MPDPTEVTDIPAEDVGTLVKQLINTQAKKIECVKQDDGNWTIRAS